MVEGCGTTQRLGSCRRNPSISTTNKRLQANHRIATSISPVADPRGNQPGGGCRGRSSGESSQLAAGSTSSSSRSEGGASKEQEQVCSHSIPLPAAELQQPPLRLQEAKKTLPPILESLHVS